MPLVLITGATGRLGSALVERLLARKDKIRAVVRKGSRHKLPPGVEAFEADLSSGPLPKEAFAGVQQVVHLAGLVGEHPYNELMLHNAFATKNLLANCPSFVHRVVIASSISVYGEHKGQLVSESFELNANSPYGKSKLMAEVFAREYCENLPIVFLRFGMIYGPGFEEGYFEVLRRLKEGKMAIIGDGSNRVPLLHVSDAVQAILLALDSKIEPCREYNIVGSEAMTQKELLLLAASELGVPAPAKTVPLSLALAVAKVKFLLGDHKLSPENILQLSLDRAYDTRRAKEELGFEARVKIKEGIKEVVGLYLKSEGQAR
ncbi:MAG: NAD(P)-dependent oxidoreductase [Candidatus Micrarchaeota archaeon]|nr:NAD(P)-dependent oxidoreductase [Candidatus Micrarchaeota archaeon]